MLSSTGQLEFGQSALPPSHMAEFFELWLQKKRFSVLFWQPCELGRGCNALREPAEGSARLRRDRDPAPREGFSSSPTTEGSMMEIVLENLGAGKEEEGGGATLHEDKAIRERQRKEETLEEVIRELKGWQKLSQGRAGKG